MSLVVRRERVVESSFVTGDGGFRVMWRGNGDVLFVMMIWLELPTVPVAAV